MPSPDAINFVAFFQRWAELQGWQVPALHLRICIWLVDEPARVRVLMVFRGAAKSTLYAIFKAWKLYRRRAHRSIIWAADDKLAGKLTRDTINVLRRHPWCIGILPPKPGAFSFWVNGATDARNPSMEALGINSNSTGSRADDADFDDIEVPKNIKTPEARANLRNKIEESTHILVPGWQKTFVGTPHTHDSIYTEQIEGGAAVLKIPLFEHSLRYEKTSERTRYSFPHPVGPDGLYVLAGIHKSARMLREGIDYRREGTEVVFAKPPGVVIDIASMCTWPERFTRDEIEAKRKETKTLNSWDSQYMLEAKPIGEVRLDPARIKAYDAEPVVQMLMGAAARRAKADVAMWLGRVRIVGAACRWDPASGKLKSDVSSLAVVLQDDHGRRYWHRALELRGEVAEFDEDGKRIVGGQVLQIVDVVRSLHLRRVSIETNGIGGFAPTVLKAALKQARLMDCGVSEVQSSANKNARILEALEDPLTSGTLWAHVSVLDGPAYDQMRDWNPAVTDQPDDHLDSLSGAVTETPERVGRAAADAGWNSPEQGRDDWRPSAGVFEVELES